MVDRSRLIRILADGKFHSGEKLSEQLGVSRSAIWQSVKKLERLGLQVYAVSGKGYRLPNPIELLEKESIERCLQFSTEVTSMEIHTEIDSTNNHLMEAAKSRPHGTHVCIAEYQTMGRGRRGRNWMSSFGNNIMLSLLKKMDLSPVELSGLSLAAGVSIAALLHESGVDNIGVKWPNDIYLNGQKLAGILIELLGESTGPSWVVLGIGLNIRIEPHTAASISQPWTHLSSVLENPNRNRLTAQILDTLIRTLNEFEHHGLQPFHETWNKFDLYYGKSVTVLQGERNIHGTQSGIDPTGALLLKTPDGEIQKHTSGEVSLRAT